MENETPTLIAHYTTSEVAINYLLPTEKLRLSSRFKLNDPVESHDYFGVTWDGLSEKFDTWELTEKWSRMHRKRFKVFCGTVDGDGKSESYLRSYTIPSMWAHYAENHEGVCVLFNTDKLLKAINESDCNLLRHGRINYKDFHDRHDIGDFKKLKSPDVDKAIIDHVREVMTPAFMVKEKCWRTEQEYRLIVEDDSDQDFAYIKILDCMDTVILGQHFDEGKLPAIRKLLPLNVNLQHIDIDGYDLSYKISDI